MTKVVQISDTHLGRTKAHFAGNWAPVASWIANEAPSLVLHTGDVSVDGADVDDDFTFSAETMVHLPAPMLAVPGNHDVGDPFSKYQPPTAERLARWDAHYGADHWVHDLDGWRLLGFDSMITSSNSAAEEAQYRWLEAQMASADGRRIAWFLHQPLFLDRWDEGDNGYWTVRTGPRARLHEIARRHPVSLVASGHLHQARQMRVGDIDFVWCPSSAFVCGPVLQEPLGGERWLGAVSYDFRPGGVDIRMQKLPQLEHLVLDDFVNEVYPPRD